MSFILNKEKLKIWWLYLTVFITGAAVLIIEILGTRILAPFYGSTIFVWSSLILVTLAALAAGYFIGGRLADKTNNFKSPYPALLSSGLFTVLSVKIHQPILILSDKFGIQYGPFVGALLLFFTPLFFLGMVSPMVIRIVTKSIDKIGSEAGLVFALGTLGSLVGGYLAGFILIPLFPISKIFLLTGLILITLGIWGLIISGHGFRWWIVCAIVVFATPFLKDGSYTATDVLYHTNSFYGDIKITGSTGKPCLYVNGSNQTCVVLNNLKSPDSVFFKQSAELMKGLSKDSRVLVLGLGGGAINSVAPDDIYVDSVEIDPKIAELAESYFGLVKTSRQKVIIDDAKHFIRKSPPETYDLILEDIALGSHIPYYIFSQESFFQMKRLLKPGGLLVAHIGIGIDGEDKLAESIVKTAQSAFKNVDVYSSNSKLFSNFIVYLYDEPTKLADLPSNYYDYDGLKLSSAKIMTDDFNLLEKYYLPYAIEELKNARNIGNKILFSN